MSHLKKVFSDKKKQGEKALITYLTAGDPNIKQTEQLIYAKERGGADIIEIGIPFSDPLADGPIIQAAAQRAFDAGITLSKVFDCVRNVRKNTEVPLVFLVYYNTVFAYGIEKFIRTCEEVGIDGLIIPDLPMEEREEIMPYIEDFAVELIPLVAVTSKQRMQSIIQGGGGFVYCISSLGVTGMRKKFHKDLETFLYEVKANTDLPIAVGFGVSDKEDVKRLQPYVDGVIVGSAIVKKIEETNGDTNAIEDFVKMLKIK